MKNESKRKKAIALTYDIHKDFAPKVSASGKGYVAEKILEKAKSHDIPIYEDESLAELLSTLNINERIPEELYQAVAEVFAFIYEVDQEYSQKRNKA
jgi:flagellar biosynthesis protein